MPKVYSWEEVRKGKVATKARISKSRKQAEKLIQKLLKRGWIETACIYGSTARNDFKIGSDIDILVVSKPEKFEVTQRFISRAYKASKSVLFVEPEIIHIDSIEARKGNHSVDALLFKHMLTSGIVFGTPLKKIFRVPSPSARTSQKILLRHLANAASKERARLSEAKASKGEGYYKILEHTIERPLNTARHTLQLNGLARKEDTKKAVAKKFAEITRQNPELSTFFSQNLQARTAYLQALESSLRAVASGNKAQIRKARTVYSNALQQIESNTRHTRRFYQENLKLISQRRRH